MRIEPDRVFGRRECPSCGVEVSVNHNHCPLCGYEFPHPTLRQRGMRVGGAILMLSILVYAVLRLFFLT